MITKSKKYKVLKRVFAFALAVIMAVPNMSIGQAFAADSKIDVWDFGAEQLDETIYNNKLTVDEINGWFPGVEAGTTGQTIAQFTTSDGELSFAGGGKTNHRLRTSNAALTCYDQGKYLTDANGVVYNGYIYSNSGANTGVTISINATAGDILTYVVGSNGGNATVHFEGPSGVEATQEFVADATNGSKYAQIMTFYPKETGTYKLYYSTEKLVVGRIYREHTAPVAVTGNVTAPEALTAYSIAFTNAANGVQTVVPVTDGTYSATLNASYTYDVSLVDANGYVITSESSLTLDKGTTEKAFDINVISVDMVTITGNITGLSADALSKLSLAFESDNIYVPEVVITDTTYSVQVETGATYTVVATGINDYEITSSTTVSYTEAGTADITFAAKPTYAVTIAPEGATLSDLAGATFTFTNLNEEGYVYTFVGTDGIALRDGTYSVKVTNSGSFVQQLTSNVRINGEAVTKTIPFDGDVSTWDFSAEDFAGTSPYNGLVFTNASKNKTYLLANAGTITVPVDGPCQIAVSACYKYSFYFAADTEASVEQNTGSTSQIDTFTYDYTGAAGTVDITVLGQSYITKIEVLDAVAYKDTVTVGATGCDFTTINDALDAVAAMPRPNNERVTIEIQPGNYEEMLVIKVPNVTLKNASANPSIELKNKGVDIDANAVRITSYYGHGYTYYSMGPDCKYDETILNVNKENGYASFTNPGTGTTSGSYWNATVVVGASGFEAEGIIFENSFNQYVSAKAANDVIEAQSSAKEPASAPRAGLAQGSTAVQDKAYVERAAALAIKDNCKEVSFDNCKFIGRQDTLYGGKNSTVAFYGCDVLGACDYIFGGMTAVFAKCNLVFNTGETGTDVGYITAPQTPANTRGYLMYNCTVTSTTPGVDTASEYTSKPGYFGRPWAVNTGEAVFYKTVVEASDTHWYDISPSLIRPDGWLNSLSGESALCGEYGTYEMAKDVDNSASRAAWSAVFTEETLADGKPIAVATFLGDWDAFAGKDMTITMPTDKVDNAPQPEPPAGGETTDVTYVLDTTTDLAAMTAGTKADGDMETAGTEGYFTIIYSAKTKIDASKKTFEDAYESTQRLNFGGKTDLTVPKNAIQFKTENPATVKVWFVEGGDDNRQVAILDQDGNVVTTTAGTYTKNQPYVEEFELTEAGSYYVANPTNNNNFCKVEVTEHVPAAAEAKEYILDTTADLTAMTAGTKADGDIEAAGTDGFFNIIYSAKTKIDASTKVFDDAYESTQRLNFGGKTDLTVPKNAIQFTTDNKATVKVWFVEGGDDNRQVAILDKDGNTVAITAGTYTKNQPYIEEFELDAAGTYYVANPTNNNNFCKISVVVEPVVAPTDYILDTTTDLTAMTAGTKADGDIEAAGTDGFFNIIYSAKTKIDASTKVFEDAYESTQRLNFGGKTDLSVPKNAIQFTTTNAADVKIWFVQGGDDNRQVAILDTDGNTVAITAGTYEKNQPYIETLSVPAAGTYYIANPTNNNNFCKIQVTVAGGGVSKPERADWANVAAPVILNAVQDGNDVKVNVSAVVGYDGADDIVVTMTDATGAEIGTKRSIAEKDTHTLTFTPTASGTYTFSVVANREGEEAKAGVATLSFDYVLPLTTPAVSSAVCNGGGSVTIAWSPVAEADSYIVTAEGTEISTTVTGTSATLEGLEIGKIYTFGVVAVRGTEQSGKGTIEWKVVDASQRGWAFSAFGQGVSTSTNKATGSVYDNDLVVASLDGKGKLVPASTDGLAFYYTTIDPETENFTLAADIVVNQWTYSNGQEGFGMMAADAVGTHGDSSVFWNNSYMNSVTKVEYYWDSTTNSVGESGTKISMRLGVGAQEKIGVSADNIASIAGGDLTPFSSKMYALDATAGQRGHGAGNYNIVGNYTKDPGMIDILPLQQTFHMEITRNNTGYFLTYTDEQGNKSTQKFYHNDEYGDELTRIDADNIYVGFFASRNAEITIKNVELTTIHPNDDAPAESRPVTIVTPNYSMESGKLSNSSNYELVFYGNADGKLTITGPSGTVCEDYAVTALEKARFDTLLDMGDNTFHVTFVPNPDYKPSEYEVLESYSPVEFDFTVKYEVNSGDIIYISPEGTSRGAGTKEDPMDIYTAVAKAAPGQKLYLMEGNYSLRKTVTVERGVNGTADAMIYLMADPEATTRPVLDFNKSCAGMVFAGDYWFLQGFDVTKSAPSQKGLQISGDYNVVDSVNAYRNGNTGIQLSRYKSSDLYEDWPANNLVINCTSYLNADPGYEDADGFAAKLTIGDGNVFDGCIAAYNADDGWDLFAKIESGPIGSVTIKNSIAFKNGYDIDENGNEINAGNGNGFKMGGSSISGYHVLENSFAFANKAKGIDSNSCPDIQVADSIAFNNGSYNVAFYTNDAANTDYSASGIISFKDANGNTTGENLKPKGNQDTNKIYGESNYYYPDGNTAGVKADATWFVSLDTDAAIHGGITRNADGTINMGGYLELTDSAPANTNAVMGGTPSTVVDTRTVTEVIEDAIADVEAATTPEEIAKALEDVLALPDSVWKDTKTKYEEIQALIKLSDAVEAKTQTSIGIENNASKLAVSEVLTGIENLPVGENGTLVLGEAEVPKTLPEELMNCRLENATAATIKLVDSAQQDVDIKVPVSVVFDTAATLNGNPIVVLVYLEDGTVEIYDAEFNKDGKVEYVVADAGTYVLANLLDEAALNPSYPSSGSTGGSADAGEATAPSAGSSAPSKDSTSGDKTSPQTSDSTTAKDDTTVVPPTKDDSVPVEKAPEPGVLAVVPGSTSMFPIACAAVVLVVAVSFIVLLLNKKNEEEE